MDYHTEWKDFNRQIIGIFAAGLLLCGSLYYFIANAFVNADFLDALRWRGIPTEDRK